MRGISKKMFISILTSVIVMVTMFATTFAWVGIFTYANTDKISLNLRVQDLSANYFLTISGSGVKKTFSNNVPTDELERQIVNNKYNNIYKEQDNNFIHNLFNNIKLGCVSTLNNRPILDFYSLDFGSKYQASFKKSNEYYKFDIYLSVDTKEGISSNTTGIRSNVFLTEIEKTLTGTETSYRFVNKNPFIDLPSDSITNILHTLPDFNTFKLNSANATRFAVALYNPINIEDDYTDEDVPINTLIYQGGKQYPNYDSITDLYDLGGILEHKYNTASQEIIQIRHSFSEGDIYYSKLNETISNRNDLELTNENSTIWNKHEHSTYLGCMDGIQTKMKLTIYLWFEGWDSDCVKAIVDKPISLNLTFTSGTDDE